MLLVHVNQSYSFILFPLSSPYSPCHMSVSRYLTILLADLLLCLITVPPLDPALRLTSFLFHVYTSLVALHLLRTALRLLFLRFLALCSSTFPSCHHILSFIFFAPVLVHFCLFLRISAFPFSLLHSLCLFSSLFLAIILSFYSPLISQFNFIFAPCFLFASVCFPLSP